MRRLHTAIVTGLGTAVLAAQCVLGCSSSTTVHTQGGRRNTFADVDASRSDGSTGGDNNSGNLFGGGPPPPAGNTSGHGSNGSGDGGGDDAGAFGHHDYPDATFDYTPPIEGTDACAAVQAGATLSKRPVDIIISIDNSGSMAGEIQAVIDRINVDFAQIIENSGIDYRVIMVSRYGDLNFTLGDTNFSVCIGPPLGNANCPTNPAPTLVNTARFFHHSTDIGSYNMWCRLLESYVTTDEYPESRTGWTPLAPNGWRDWLRPEALKMFVGITDDSPGTNAGGTNQRCTTASGLTNDQMGAQAFDQALRTLDPAQFGAYDAQDPDANRNYRWYSIVGLTSKAAPDELVAYEPAEPIVTTVCTGPNAGSTDDDGQSAGQGYQYLSQMTGGLRYSSCLNDDFDAIFNAIAQGVVEGAKLNCDFDIPQVNGEINFDNVTVNYLEGGADAGMPHSLVRVPSAADCNADNQYYLGTQGDAGGAAYNHVFLCADACTAVQADPKAQMQIDFGCLGQ